MSVDGRGWGLPVSTLCTVLNSRTDKGVSSRKPSAKPRFLISSCDKQFGVCSLSARWGARWPQFCPEGGPFFGLHFWRLVRGVVEGGFLHTVVLRRLFHGHVQGRFPRAHAVPPHRTLIFEINTDPRCAKKDVCRAPLFRAMRVRCTTTAVLIGMTLIFCCSVVIRWLQSGVVVPRVTHPPSGDADTFVNGRDGNVVRETVVATPGSLACAHVVPPSLGSCVRRVRGIPCYPRRHPRCSQSTPLGRVPQVLRARRSSPLLLH